MQLRRRDRRLCTNSKSSKIGCSQGSMQKKTSTTPTGRKCWHLRRVLTRRCKTPLDMRKMRFQMLRKKKGRSLSCLETKPSCLSNSELNAKASVMMRSRRLKSMQESTKKSKLRLVSSRRRESRLRKSCACRRTKSSAWWNSKRFVLLSTSQQHFCPLLLLASSYKRMSVLRKSNKIVAETRIQWDAC